MKDGSVSGRIGDAVLDHCIVHKNRGPLFRWLGFKSDYIIKGGVLYKKICEGDPLNEPGTYTLPFNITDSTLSGAVMLICKWKYPDSLVLVNLAKQISLGAN